MTVWAGIAGAGVTVGVHLVLWATGSQGTLDQ
jgi:hypothetical protein